MADQGERFENEITSIIQAPQGWHVYVQHVTKDAKTGRQEVGEESAMPVVAWALVKRTFASGSSGNKTEPVFVHEGDLINASEYKRMYAIYDLPGHDDVSIRIKLLAPGASVPL